MPASRVLVRFAHPAHSYSTPPLVKQGFDLALEHGGNSDALRVAHARPEEP